MTNGEAPPRRGEVWWVRADKRRPAVVVQTDKVREARVRSFLVVPLTSRLHLSHLPGNIRLDQRATGLSRSSVANVYDVQKVFRSDFAGRAAALSPRAIAELEDGLRLVFDL